MFNNIPLKSLEKIKIAIVIITATSNEYATNKNQPLIMGKNSKIK